MLKKLASVSALALAVTLTGCSAGGTNPDASGAESYSWDMTITVGNTSTWYEGAEYFADTLNDETDGRIEVNIFTNEQLSGGDPAAGVEQLMNGDKDLSYNSTIIYAGIDPKYGAVNAPFLYADYEEAEDTLAATGLDAYRALAAPAGVQVLGFGESGFRQITNNVRAISTPDDLAAMKMRIPGIGLFTDIYRELGANPTTLNFSEVFTALQQGTIDGQENPVEVTHSSGITEVQDHMTMWNYVYDPLILGMNKALFDSLSADDQELVLRVSAEANAIQIQANRDKDADSLQEMKDSGMEVTELTAAERNVFVERMVSVKEKYASTWGEDMVAGVTPNSTQP
ncbi:DctP family TRAP transporter solute-binding subunit [Cryobacterium sp. CG_9.6]|uniref:DctP family TRAP transporter solute-binding subunit n=1 Tax=Cryobacterium sp. CG_9.6 TaxID=2760710 RepID=UPI00247493B3|nr:DctP family TRAP transporter solute-binding subunit [Cryobacterium sp. CG_9.6]MDH6238118.1 C4-dicarboxylate transporter DctM subunit [Cryobacterium sp. CG_9.6]